MANSKGYLDPFNQEFVDSLPAGPPLEELSVKRIRALVEQLSEHEQLPGVKRTSFEAPVAGGVKTWLYTPEGSSSELLPFIYYVHGGLWMAGSINTHDSIVTDLVLRTKFAVVFPEYTRSPEVTFPTIEDECFAVLKWLTKNGEKKGLQKTNFALVSDSVGAQLAASLNFRWQDTKQQIQIKYNVMTCPELESSTTNRSTPSEFLFFNGPLYTVPLKHRAIELYIPDEDDRTTDLGNPSLISDKHARGFGPTLVIVSSTDLLRAEGEDFGRKLQQAGTECAIVRGDGLVHNFNLFETARASPTSKAIASMISETLVERLGDVSHDLKSIQRKRRRVRA
ncbi:alpha/beta hydrolase fold-domain-containing protein [Cadophora sp. MPI-SDFR-AT-0126]|nr:alpha/beta hydrolase fold-domain-containing protein [Leotiomycetes sp. MPI-SDFR-AT-0126]